MWNRDSFTAEKKIFWIQFIALAIIVSSVEYTFHNFWIHLKGHGFIIIFLEHAGSGTISILLSLFVGISLYQFKNWARLLIVFYLSLILFSVLVFSPFLLYSSYFSHHPKSEPAFNYALYFIKGILFFLTVFLVKQFLFQKYRSTKFLIGIGFIAGIILCGFDILGEYLYPTPITIFGNHGELVLDWIVRLFSLLGFALIIYFLTRPQVKIYFISSPSEDNSHPVPTSTMSITPQI